MKLVFAILLAFSSISAAAVCVDPCSDGSIATNDYYWRNGTVPGSDYFYRNGADGPEHPLTRYKVCNSFSPISLSQHKFVAL